MLKRQRPRVRQIQRDSVTGSGNDRQVRKLSTLLKLLAPATTTSGGRGHNLIGYGDVGRDSRGASPEARSSGQEVDDLRHAGHRRIKSSPFKERHNVQSAALDTLLGEEDR